MVSTQTPTANQGSANGSTPLICLNGVTKVFLTDEVETHALSGIHLDIRMGEYLSIAGPSGCGKSTFLSGAGANPEPGDWIHFPKLQSLRGSDRLRER